jgi:hypothetical protein
MVSEIITFLTIVAVPVTLQGAGYFVMYGKSFATNRRPYYISAAVLFCCWLALMIGIFGPLLNQMIRMM